MFGDYIKTADDLVKFAEDMLDLMEDMDALEDLITRGRETMVEYLEFRLRQALEGIIKVKGEL